MGRFRVNPDALWIDLPQLTIISARSQILILSDRLLGLRWRILNLPVMVALIITMIWRQVPSVLTLAQMMHNEPLLWTPPVHASQQALSQRLRCLPSQLFAKLLQTIMPLLLERAAARTRPQPPVVERALKHFDHIWIMDATTLEALFHKVGLLRDAAETALA